jgi:ABC-type multidrug transport system fused ATPase/permease subunit
VGKKQSNSKKTGMKGQLSILFDFFMNRKILVLSVLLIFLINSAASIVAPLFLGKLIDVFRTQKQLNVETLLVNGKEFIGIFIVLILMQVISGIVLAYLRKESVIHYQNFIFNKIIMLPYLQLIKFRTAYLQNRWGRDSLNLSNFYSDNLFGMVENFFIIVLGVAVAVYISPVFSLSILLFITIMGISIGLVSRYLIKQLKIYLEKVATLSGKINEAVAGVFELKIMGFLNFFKETIRRDITKAAENHYNIRLKALIVFSLVNIVVSMGFFGTLIYFGYLISIDQITIGSAIAYVGIAFFIMKSLANLISGVNKLNTTFASLKRTTELLNAPDAKDEIPPGVNNVLGMEAVNDIELKQVWFKYDQAEDYVLRDFSCKFERGKLYAVSGKSGVGKSTLIKLLMGVIPAERGAVLINGKPLSGSVIAAFWQKLGYLSQEPFLFKGRLLENLVPGSEKSRSTYSDTDSYLEKNNIRQALEKAGLSRIDLSTPIEVEEGGKNFSGGEKRRISLARAFIKESDVLILDEPASQVDGATAEIIVDSILSFAREGKIAIIIAHSDMALRKADEEIRLTEPAAASLENETGRRPFEEILPAAV